MNRIYKFKDIGEAQIFLNGGIIGGPVLRSYAGLIGQVLTFTSPAFSVTFTAVTPAPTDRDPNGLLFRDIKAQLEAANANIQVTQVGSNICLVEKVPTNGVALGPTDEYAKNILGFDQRNATVGRVHRPLGISGGPPHFSSTYSMNESMHVVFTWE